MKRISIFTVFALMMSSAAVRAQQTPLAATCGNATLTGAYAVSIGGTQPALAVLPNLLFVLGSMEQAIGVVVQVFDGQGNFTQTDNVKGSISGIIANRPGTGTYTVNSDCTGTYTLSTKGLVVPIVTQIVIIGSGTEFRGIVVSPQNVMMAANGRRMN